MPDDNIAATYPSSTIVPVDTAGVIVQTPSNKDVHNTPEPDLINFPILGVVPLLIHNYSHAVNGKIWIVWDPRKYKVIERFTAAQLIHCFITDLSGYFSCYYTIIYGFNGLEQRKSLWEDLRKIAANITDPWFLCGDFNDVLNTNDRLFDSPITYSETKEYAECIQDLQLNELSWKGEYYTWTNKQLGSARICSRIDRAFANSEWMLKWSHNQLVYDFLYFNIWTLHSNFLNIVAEVWRRNLSKDLMDNVWKKFKALRAPLKKLNNKEFKGLGVKISKSRMDLMQIQDQLTHTCTDQLLEMEKNTILVLEKWSNIEESALKQKLRAKWIQLGDGNNKYFSAVIKDRTTRKQILELTSLSGVKLTAQEDIKREILHFYKSLMRTTAPSLDAINKVVMRTGPVLTQ
ncbi:hypothetical protein P3S67_022801 [Capsicum chacoense]|uniref:uncharacterized protein LOC107857831 n=1 Tax=Capsicum annuum TaxID=4072 RepID=UPI001FB09512|nr:uncharacterized protein LOC107857831 [Capsicum annuum]